MTEHNVKLYMLPLIGFQVSCSCGWEQLANTRLAAHGARIAHVDPASVVVAVEA